MAHGPEVAETIASLARDDKSIVGVVGLSASYRSTMDTVDTLAEAGIPVIGALSPDSFAKTMLMYYQIPPQNRREAAVVAAYAEQLLRRERSSRTAVQRRRGGARFLQLSRDHFLGRRPQPDFDNFLTMARDCPTPPVIIANNDTTRYVADETTRRKFPSVPYYYVSFAASSPPLTSRKEDDFYADYYRQFDFEHRDAGARPLDGHAALSYDVTVTFVRATQYLRDRRPRLPVLPGTVWRQIALVSGTRSFAGASGRIDFRNDINRHVPLDKPVMVLQVRNGEVVNDASGYCGAPVSEADGRTQPWCPFDR